MSNKSIAERCEECIGTGKCGPDEAPSEMDCEVCNGSGQVGSAIDAPDNSNKIVSDLKAALTDLLHNSSAPYSGDAELDRDFQIRYDKVTKRCLALLATPVVPVAAELPATDERPMIGKLLDAFSEIEHLWGLNEPGALVRHRDVFNMIVKIGKEQLAAAPVLSVGLPSQARPRDLIAAETMPKRAAFIKWIESRHLDSSVEKDAWGAHIFKNSHIQAMWEGWFNALTDSGLPSQPAEQSGSIRPSAEPAGQRDEAAPARHAIHNLKQYRIERGIFPGEALGILERFIDDHASPIAEPDTATQAPSENLNNGMHASIFVRVWGDAGGGDAGRIALAKYAFDLGAKSTATQAAKPLTDDTARLDTLFALMPLAMFCRALGIEPPTDTSLRNQSDWARQALDSAIELHLKGE